MLSRQSPIVVSVSSLSFGLFNKLPCANRKALRMSLASHSRSDIVSVFMFFIGGRAVALGVFLCVIMCVRPFRVVQLLKAQL